MRHVVVLASVLVLSGCAARVPSRPDAPGVPHPDAVDLFTRATTQCPGLSTVTTTMRLSGKAGSERLRGTLHAGLEAPASARFEAIAPFGQPVFILAGRANRATLLFPRDNTVLRDALLPEVLERLTGLRLGAGDLRMLLTGCLALPAKPRNGQLYANRWQSVIVGADTVAYVRLIDGHARVVAADDGAWRVDYTNFLNDWPRQVRIRSVSGDVDMTATLEAIEVNTAIDPRAFDVVVPSDARSITLEHLRSVVPLRATQ